MNSSDNNSGPFTFGSNISPVLHPYDNFDNENNNIIHNIIIFILSVISVILVYYLIKIILNKVSIFIKLPFSNIDKLTNTNTNTNTESTDTSNLDAPDIVVNETPESNNTNVHNYVLLGQVKPISEILQQSPEIQKIQADESQPQQEIQPQQKLQPQEIQAQLQPEQDISKVQLSEKSNEKSKVKLVDTKMLKVKTTQPLIQPTPMQPIQPTLAPQLLGPSYMSQQIQSSMPDYLSQQLQSSSKKEYTDDINMIMCKQKIVPSYCRRKQMSLNETIYKDYMNKSCPEHNHSIYDDTTQCECCMKNKQLPIYDNNECDMNKHCNTCGESNNDVNAYDYNQSYSGYNI